MQYAYDALDNRIKTTHSDNTESSQRYDEVGNKLTQTDAENSTTSWTYDALGRERTRTLPLGQSDSTNYDALGNMQSHTDFNGQLTRYLYDSNNRVSRIDYADGTFEAFSYNLEGQRVNATPREGQSQSWTYDNRQRLTQDNKANGDQLDYDYDSVGNRVALTITPNGGTAQTTGFGFDVLNRLGSVTDNNAQTTSYDYDNAGNRASVAYPNGNTTNYYYDSLNRLTQLTASNGGTILTDFQYTLDASGHRTQITEASGRTTNYTYDDVYKLLTEDISDTANGNYSASYECDKVGNRTYSTVNGIQTQYTVDDNDRLIQQGGTTYGYDDNGNTVTETLDGNTTAYSYDAKNLLISSNNGSASSYQYDVDGIRNQKVVGGETITYQTDANRDYQQVLKETNATTGNVTDYLYGDDLIKQTRAANDSYYLYDGLGSTRALTDSTGQVTDTYNYESFGEVLNQTGSTENNYLFTGEQYDAGLDNYYLRARYYNQKAGRFTQMDSWMGSDSDPITLHKYLYGNVDPVNNIDPSGNFSLSSLSTGMNIAARLIVISSPVYLTRSTYSSIDTGHAREYDTEASNYHFYEMETTICVTLNAACTVDKVFEALRRFPAPGWNSSKLVNSGDRTTIKFLGFSGGGVVHTVGNPEVRNTTLQGHIFEKGYVDRIVRKEGSQIKIITVGEGLNRSLGAKFLNLITYGPAFSHLDRQIKGNVATQ